MNEEIRKVIAGLEEIAGSAKTAKDTDSVGKTIDSVCQRIRPLAADRGGVSKNLFGELYRELEIWRSKLAVIFKEPVGRQGMARHAKFWADRIKQLET